MLLIPVIDLCHGEVVHAIAGERDSYRNIETLLCRGSAPLEIVNALLNLNPFAVIYIADLDAIKENGNNAPIIEQILLDFPRLNIWLDSGNDPYARAFANPRIRQVFGSETGITPEVIKKNKDAILSLDFIENRLLGDQGLLEQTETWPKDVIVMSLSCVGTGKGPDFERLEKIRSMVTERCIYAAGGVRHEQDLNRLSSMQVAGVLLASALHDGSINKTVMKQYCST